MDISTATEITRVMCQTRRKIEAIKILRADTKMGLIQAKDYLEVYSKDGSDDKALFKQLCDDFVQNKADLLILLVAEQRQLESRIAELMREISEEIATT